LASESDQSDFIWAFYFFPASGNNPFRPSLLAAQMPSLADAGVLALYGVAVFCVGGLIFRHLKRGFADVL